MVNNVTLLGRITKDPEVKAVGNDSAVCNFTLAVNRNFKNQQGEYEPDFINSVAFGNVAQRMGQYVSKGDMLAITGRIQTRNYENNMGQRVYITEVVANNVSFVETKKNKNQAQQQDPYTANTGISPMAFMEETIEDEDLPF